MIFTNFYVKITKSHNGRQSNKNIPRLNLMSDMSWEYKKGTRLHSNLDGAGRTEQRKIESNEMYVILLLFRLQVNTGNRGILET